MTFFPSFFILKTISFHKWAENIGLFLYVYLNIISYIFWYKNKSIHLVSPQIFIEHQEYARHCGYQPDLVDVAVTFGQVNLLRQILTA